MENFAFKKGLYQISNHLSNSEVVTLKFFLAESIPRSQLEKARTGFDIFCLMCDKDHLSPNNLSFLEEILECVHKKHFVQKYLGSLGVGSAQNPPLNIGAGQPFVGEGNGRLSGLKVFLSRDIGAELSQENVRDLALFFHGEHISMQVIERMRSAEELFDKLLTSHVLDGSNLQALQNVLDVIGRKDLSNRVAEMQQKDSTHHHSSSTMGGRTPNPHSNRPQNVPIQPIEATDRRAERSAIVTPAISSVGTPLHSGFHAFAISASSSRPDTLASLPEEKDFGSSEEPKPMTSLQLSKTAHDNDNKIKSLEKEIVQLRQEKSADRQQLQTKIDEVESLRIEAKGLRKKLDGYPVYPMETKPHGLAIIIVNGKFDPNPQLPSLELNHRAGAEKDKVLFFQTFKHLQYDPVVYENVTSIGMLSLMAEVSKRDHSKYDSFVCCVSTHGTQTGLYGSDSVEASREEFQGSIRNCESLSGKPKLFFIQACRTPYVSPDSANTGNKSEFNPNLPVVHPDTDMLIANATTVGNAAYISPYEGSWFVKALEQKLTHLSLPYERTLQQILQEVTNTVSQSSGQLSTGERVTQCVEVSTTLRAGVKFFANNKTVQ